MPEGADGSSASPPMELCRLWLGLDSSQTDCEAVRAGVKQNSCEQKLFCLARKQLSKLFAREVAL